MELKNITDSPFSWAAVGCIIGLILGVTTLSVVLLAIFNKAYDIVVAVTLDHHK